jgi:DNA-binding transcriptional regulator YdaS (Cro superfamily)
MFVDIEAENSALPKSSDLLVAEALSREEFCGGEQYGDSESETKTTTGDAQHYNLPDIIALITGVIAPSALLLSSALACSERVTMLILKHPIESLIEIALVLLVPIANYKVLTAVAKKELRSPIRNGLMIGMAMGVSVLAGVVCLVANGLVYPTADKAGNSFSFLITAIAIISLASSATSACLALRLRGLREFSSAKLRAGIYCVSGILLALLLVAGSEAKSVCIRVSEYMATSENKDEREKALQFLRVLKPELELRMECSDERAGGLPGMFIQLDPIAQRQVYFAVTGQPFRDSKAANYAAMSDDYLHRHVVGASIPGLSLLRSAITGSISADSLAATVNWTYVLKNRTYYDQEARAQFSLPPGAVINGVTLWVNGEPRHAQTVPNADVANAAVANPVLANTAQGITLGHDVNTLVSDLGRGRYLVHCFPVPSQGELKVSMTIVSPVQPTSLTDASVTLPRFIDTNFSLAGEHSLRLRSKQTMALSLPGVKQGSLPTGEHLLTCNLREDDLTGPGITICLNGMPKYESVSAFDPITSTYVSQSLNHVPASIPKNLIVVLDGTESMRGKLDEIKKGLGKLPKSISASLLLANEDKSLEPQPLKQALSGLSAASFVGGQNNLSAVVKAAELAGETEGGAVLWIHGAQPSLNQELYITSPYTVAPAFYELPADNGVTDANEFFKNHKEIGAFKVIGRSGTIDEDLNRFLSKWQPGGSEFVLGFKASNTKPEGKILAGEQAREITSSYFDRQCQNLIAGAQLHAAANLGSRHGLVTPASTSLVWLARNGQRSTIASSMTSQVVSDRPDQYALRSNEMSGNSIFVQSADQFVATNQPQLQGVSNGTIGPQGSDVTYVTGVNTAGTVRVNNLANLEAMLNILANLGEVAGILVGGWLIGCTFITQVSWFNVKITRTRAIVYGVIFVVAGLAFPGIINWFVASSRDANLFS